ncbi:MAG: anaerobic carbon-monoxide dehydrogenase catalytic subunit [Planctomycetes bacterium]|nr:anaerobic carbon-monoxide dehydrogenase catalytic subunit [Planctomycetota bacterium]
MIAKAGAEGVPTCFSRLAAHGPPCAFGTSGLCCRVCNLGPCRITRQRPRGVCGADADTIVARNLLRQVAAGSAAHCDHARHMVELLRDLAAGRAEGYRIEDPAALRRAGRLYGLETERKPDLALAGELADVWLAEFTAQDRPMRSLALAPPARRERWRAAGLSAAGIDRTIVEALHRTVMGVDHDYRHLLAHTLRTALADGYGGSAIATMAGDILFGTPRPVESVANLGVLHADRVNVVVHGHNPAVSEKIAQAAGSPEIAALARAAGAAGVNLVGICCTGHEVLHRHGIALAGGVLQQELAIVTGAVEMMITDVQCCMPGLAQAAAGYHTELVTTSDIARTEGFTPEPFDGRDDDGHARRLLARAVSHFRRREAARVAIPSQRAPVLAGFSVQAIRGLLGGSLRPLVERLADGRIRGVAAIIGCSNPKVASDRYAAELVRGLISRDVLVANTGCAAAASAREGLLSPALAVPQAGPGLRQLHEQYALPPVLHLGSCVNNARFLELGAALAAELDGRADLGDLPLVATAPEWISEKVPAIGCYLVASGVDVILGQDLQTTGSPNVEAFLSRHARELLGAGVHVCLDPAGALGRAMELLDSRRARRAARVSPTAGRPTSSALRAP